MNGAFVSTKTTHNVSFVFVDPWRDLWNSQSRFWSGWHECNCVGKQSLRDPITCFWNRQVALRQTKVIDIFFPISVAYNTGPPCNRVNSLNIFLPSSNIFLGYPDKIYSVLYLWIKCRQDDYWVIGHNEYKGQRSSLLKYHLLTALMFLKIFFTDLNSCTYRSSRL